MARVNHLIAFYMAHLNHLIAHLNHLIVSVNHLIGAIKRKMEAIKRQLMHPAPKDLTCLQDAHLTDTPTNVEQITTRST